MPKKSSPLLAAGLAAGAVAGLAGTAYYWLLRRPLAQKSGATRLAGLEKAVEVIRDRWGVPHIYAQNLPDLLYAQGYVHAQDRLWQMDFNRRLVAGRLSELFGTLSVQLDRWMRTLTMRRTAEQEVVLLSEDERSLLDAYARGVNARIAQGKLPVEFTLLGYQPEPWTVADILAWPKMMAWTLSVNWETEILRALLVERLGAEQAAELEPPYAPGMPYVIPVGVDYSCLSAAPLKRARDARQHLGPDAREGAGSNNWVLSGDRTVTGKPLLANDMHLGLTIPSVWYENHLEAGGLRLSGISFPGIPLIIAGHNGRVAWGFTNGFPDVQDLYMEHLRRTDAGEVEYEFQDAWHTAQVLREVIQVKSAQPVVEEVVVTRHGPVINLLNPELAGETPLALRWTALEPANLLRALFEMVQAGDCQSFTQALRHWTVPAQNIVSADVDGNIAYSMPGRIPIRAQGDGRLPVPGWTGEYEWESYIPFEELPHMFNPAPGYIATANNRVADAGYPFYLSSDYIGAGRISRIHELIQSVDKVDPAYIQRMHVDQVSIFARQIARSLSQLATEDPELQIVLRNLQDWDGTLTTDSSQASVYEAFLLRLALRLLEPRLGDLALHYIGKGITPVLSEGSMLGERCVEWLLGLLDQPDSHWWDLGGGETRQQQMLAALREAVDMLKNTLGPEFGDWSWGKLHQLTLAHTLGSKKPLDRLFNRGPYPIGGDYDTLWNSGMARHTLESGPVVGPPFRFIADLDDLGRSLGQLLPGQSGQPTSPHYADNIQPWLKGEYHPMLFHRPDVLEHAAATLKLLPVSEAA